MTPFRQERVKDTKEIDGKTYRNLWIRVHDVLMESLLRLIMSLTDQFVVRKTSNVCEKDRQRMKRNRRISSRILQDKTRQDKRERGLPSKKKCDTKLTRIDE